MEQHKTAEQRLAALTGISELQAYYHLRARNDLARQAAARSGGYHAKG